MNPRRRSTVFALLVAAVCAPALVCAQAGPHKELEPLARALRESKSAADYARLRAFAESNADSDAGRRAALALGYHDYTKKNFPQAVAWLDRSEGDRLLREYALYWGAQARRALGQHDAALQKLEMLRKESPRSAIGEQAWQALAEASLAAGQGNRALEVLATIPKVESSAELLLLRARAYEQGGEPRRAAADYAAVYHGFPLSSEATFAGKKIDGLRAHLGEKFLAVSTDHKFQRAQGLFDGRRWTQARSEFTALLPQLPAAQRDLARLRIAQIRLSQGASPAVLDGLELKNAAVDAERLYLLSQTHRSRRNIPAMLDATEKAVKEYPKSSWTDEALFAAGNYHWVALDREGAAKYYRRVCELFPRGDNAPAAHWRVAWTEYLARSAQAVPQMEEHLRLYPSSPFATSAIYWLGRRAERDGNAAHARSFYLKLINRWPETYFGIQAEARMRSLGAGVTNESEVLNSIPPAPDAPQLDEAIPAAAMPRWQRAQALRSIAFDASAELELRAAHAETGSARLLVEAAQAAQDAGRPMQGVIVARQAVRQLEARRVEDGLKEIWRLVYPLPYGEEIEKAAQGRDLDPMLVAGLIRQESLFEPAAVSRAGAVGLMQILPRTGRALARDLGLRYSRSRLTDPEFNLRLGAKHLADLLQRFGRLDVALAAYNGGGSRAVRWQAEREHEDPNEFIESIPFTETREYVQNVLRNAEVYRRLYAKNQ